MLRLRVFKVDMRRGLEKLQNQGWWAYSFGIPGSILVIPPVDRFFTLQEDIHIEERTEQYPWIYFYGKGRRVNRFSIFDIEFRQGLGAHHFKVTHYNRIIKPMRDVSAFFDELRNVVKEIFKASPVVPVDDAFIASNRGVGFAMGGGLYRVPTLRQSGVHAFKTNYSSTIGVFRFTGSPDTKAVYIAPLLLIKLWYGMAIMDFQGMSNGVTYPGIHILSEEVPGITLKRVQLEKYFEDPIASWPINNFLVCPFLLLSGRVPVVKYFSKEGILIREPVDGPFQEGPPWGYKPAYDSDLPYFSDLLPPFVRTTISFTEP